MYMDKLDGRIDAEFFDRKAAEFRAGQRRVRRDLDAHQVANHTYVEEGIQLRKLARRAHGSFESQVAGEKRKLLDLVVSSCRWKAGELAAESRQPCNLIALAAQALHDAAAGGPKSTILITGGDGGIRTRMSLRYDRPPTGWATSCPTSPNWQRVAGSNHMPCGIPGTQDQLPSTGGTLYSWRRARDSNPEVLALRPASNGVGCLLPMLSWSAGPDSNRVRTGLQSAASTTSASGA